MKRLLLFNLRTDADDPILGFATQWINGLAQHFDSVDVITTHQGRLAVADNVRVFSVGREKGYGRLRSFAVFYGLLFRLLLTRRYVACFAHMQPLFALLAGVPLWVFGVRQVLWYTHKERTRQLEWGTRLSWRVVSADKSSFPIDTPKLVVTGHGINTDFFTPSPQTPPPSLPPKIVYVARLTPIKHQETLIRAMAHVDAQAHLIGDIPHGYDDAYKQHLTTLTETLGLRGKVFFVGAMPPDAIQQAYYGATLAVNLSPMGLFDKAALEAMACGVPTLSANPALASLAPMFSKETLISAPDDVEGLLQRLNALLALDNAQRAKIGQAQRAGVVAHHSFNALMLTLSKLLTERLF